MTSISVVTVDRVRPKSDRKPPYFLCPLSPRITGLPMTVWVSPSGSACHDVLVKVNMTHGNQMNIDNTAVVGVRPSPHLIAGQLSPDDERAVATWITLNADAIVAYWNGDIDTLELVQTLRRLGAE
jgi:hypothetical protein